MASKAASTALFLMLNILFFTLVSSQCPPPPKPSCGSCSGSRSGSGFGKGSCPKDALKFGICADVLGSLLDVNLGTPPKTPCCSLIEGLVDLEAAVCLCTALKANILGLNLNLPISLSLLVNYCGKKVPSGFQCS